jgi:ribosomal protein S19
MEGMITATRLMGVDEDVEPQFIDLDPVDVLHDTQMVIITGRVKVGSVVTVNDQPVHVDQQGRFRFEAKLEQQNNAFEIVAKDPSGKIARRVVNIERQTDELEIQMKVEEKYIEAQEASIRGKVLRTKLTEETPSRRIWIFVNGIEAQVVPDDRHIEFTFEATVPLDYGRNRIEVNVRTAEGFAKKVLEVNNYRKASIELQINNDRALINGEQKVIDAAPYISAGRTFVPLRVVAEGFGAEVTWVQQTRGINITLGDQVISMQIGSNRAMVNNEMVHMDAPPEIKNGRTFVPIRFVSEMLGAEVEWVQATRTVKIVRLILD